MLAPRLKAINAVTSVKKSLSKWKRDYKPAALSNLCALNAEVKNE